MLYEIWYQVSRTVFPFISLKRHRNIVDAYDARLDAYVDAYTALGEQYDAAETALSDAYGVTQALRDELALWHDAPEPLNNFTVGLDKPATSGRVILDSDDEALARMDTDGSIHPDIWKGLTDGEEHR